MDHPKAMRRLILLDIAPTLAMYSQTDETFARSYWHWFFLIRPAPLPETLLEADPELVLRSAVATHADYVHPFSDAAYAEYLRCMKLPGTIHAFCEDYRASAGIDLQHDREDRAAGRRIEAPLLVLWGAKGVIERCFDPLKEWREVATDVQGKALPAGHYIPEEVPDLLLKEALEFLA
jgi:haloacetate dehalogenase